MSAKAAGTLLPAGRDVPFAEIEVTLARLVRDGRRSKRAPARALTATVIVVGTADCLPAAADALEQLGEVGGVRAIMISEGTKTSPTARVTENAIAIAGLAPRFLNNAVAALRLSSLPAMVWWRGGSVEALEDLAALADRMVLDEESPAASWSHAPEYFEDTALTDLRWTRLTRWRSALAHMFDLPRVRDAAQQFNQLSITATDRDAARLFAGWVRARLAWPADAAISIEEAPAPGSGMPAALLNVTLAAPGLTLSVARKDAGTCLIASVDADPATARVVPLADDSLASMIGEELGVRTRDLAFEQALLSALEMSR